MDLSAIATAGLDVAQSRFEKAATGLASVETGAAPVDTVSLSGQAVSLLSARNEFATDLRVAHVADAMRKAALNLLA